MPDYPTSLINLIDQRIDQSALKPTKMGTVQDRTGSNAIAVVSFDGGSGVGQPVKCFENVVVDIGDRVGMCKLEGEWVIVGSYTPREWGDILVGLDIGSTLTMTSASFVDMPSSPKANFVKYRDSTQLQIWIAFSCYTTVQPTVFEVGANITLPDASQFDQTLYHRVLHIVNTHQDHMGGITTPGLTLPAGGYSVTGRWRRTTGTGVMTMDVNDSCTIHVKEVVS